MATPLGPVDRHDDDEEQEVDIDLDLLDEVLRREALGQATTVKLDGKVIHILHAGDWSSSAMSAATQGQWEVWAREVIEDDTEYQTWLDADLRNYQMEAVFAECARQARLNMGKSRRPSGSRHRSRRR